MATQTGAADTVSQAQGQAVFEKFGRRWDILLILVVLPAFAAVVHVTHMLTVGDWDFWADWKDRQWWPLLTPVVGIIIPATAQYVLWRFAAIAGGATAAALLLVASQWISRELSFSALAYFPLGFVAPATMIPLAVLLDVILVVSRSLVITAVVGGMAWGLLFQPANLALFAPVWQSVLYHGDLLTVADVWGFEYLRSQTPAYLRIVEEGHLRAFISQAAYVTGVTAGMAAIGGCAIGYLIARYVAIMPTRVFLKTSSPLLRFLHPQADPKWSDDATQTGSKAPR